MKNDSAKIVFIEGPHDQLEIPLAQNSLYVGRRDGTIKQQADIDLSPDFKVSRKHARLCFKNSTWWIQDTRSKHGTMVHGKEIKGLTMPTKLGPGVPVKTGNTVWMIAPSNYVQVRLGDLTIGFTKVSAVNYALYHCGIPIISDFVIRNKGSLTSPPLMLTISIKGYSQPWHKHLDHLVPGGKFVLNKIHLNLDYERLEGNEGRKKARLNLQLNDDTIFTDEIHILGFFEWATDHVCRKSLACFVQPSHPVVQNIVLDAVGYLKEAPGFTHLLKTERSDKAECALRALYECLKEKYQIHYVLEPVSFEAGAQVIRSPQRVMSETWRGRGKGTCIDLTLLLASCLENIRLQPLIIFVKEKGPYQHAFLGCWKEVAERFRPIVTEIKDMDNEQIVLLESTGFTDRWGKRLTYDEAVKKAGEQFCQERFLFAVDIAGARQTVVPLQFPMSPGAIGILREAEALARKEKSAKLETGHLLRSLLLDEDKEINEILERAGADLALLELKIAESKSMLAIPAKDGAAPRPTINYRRVLEDARLIASDTGTGFTEKIHFFYALLLSQSESVDFILNQISSDRKQAKSVFDKRLGWTGEIVQTYFETT